MGQLSIRRRKFFERKETVPALACDFEREVFLLYAKIVSRDRLLLLYNFLQQQTMCSRSYPRFL